MYIAILNLECPITSHSWLTWDGYLLDINLKSKDENLDNVGLIFFLCGYRELF